MGDRAGPRPPHRGTAARRAPAVSPGAERRRSGVRAGIPAVEREVSLALNPAQEAAVRYPGGLLLVLAGVGSGRNRVLTAVIGCLVQERGVVPSPIVAVTFL